MRRWAFAVLLLALLALSFAFVGRDLVWDNATPPAPAPAASEVVGPARGTSAASSAKERGRAARPGRDDSDATAEADPDEGLRRVRVRVVDDSGTPVAGAELTAVGRRNVAGAGPARTDGGGGASIALSEEERLVVEAAGFARTEVDVPDDAPELTVVLAEGNVIAGVVVDASGRGVPDAEVDLDLRTGSLRQRSDAHGAFAFRGLASVPVEGELFATDGTRRGYGSALPGRVDVRVVVRAPGVVRGVVLLPDGSPATQAHVLAAGWIRARGVDEGGRFELADLVPGPVEIVARRELGWDDAAELRGVAHVEVPDGGVADAEIRLAVETERSVVAVQVEDAAGSPVEQAWVEAWRGDVRVASSETRRGGVAHLFCNLEPGSALRLLAKAHAQRGHDDPAASAETTTSAVVAQPPKAVALRLGATGRLIVRLHDASGNPVPLAAAHLTDVNRTLEPSADGSFPLHPMLPRLVEIEVDGFARRRIAVVPPHPPVRELTVRLVPEVTVTGRVLDADGSPAREDTVVVVSVRADGGREADSVTLDEAGRFELFRLPAGPATLQVLDPGSSFGPRVHLAVNVGPGETTDLGDIRLPPVGPVEGVVADASGGGLGGARLHFEDPDGKPVADARVSGADGRFRVRLPRRPGIRLVVVREGFGAAAVDVPAAGSDPVRVVLRPGGRVSVPRTRHGSGDDVEARLPGAAWSWRPPSEAAPRADVYDTLPEGRVELTRRVLGVEQRAVVDVVAGRTVEAVFEDVPPR